MLLAFLLCLSAFLFVLQPHLLQFGLFPQTGLPLQLNLRRVLRFDNHRCADARGCGEHICSRIAQVIPARGTSSASDPFHDLFLNNLFLYHGGLVDYGIIVRYVVVDTLVASEGEFITAVLTWAVLQEPYRPVGHEAVDCIILVTASTVVSDEPLIPVPISGLYGFAYPVRDQINGYRLRLMVACHFIGHPQYALRIRGFATAESNPVPLLFGVRTAVYVCLVHPRTSVSGLRSNQTAFIGHIISVVFVSVRPGVGNEYRAVFPTGRGLYDAVSSIVPLLFSVPVNDLTGVDQCELLFGNSPAVHVYDRL